MQRELVFGSLKSPPVCGGVQQNPFAVGASAGSRLMCAVLAEQQLPCSCYMAGRFHQGEGVECGPLWDLCMLGFGSISLFQTALSHLLTF